MKFKAYHKIKQFKDAVRDIKFKANYKGKDEKGDPIYEESSKPTIPFIGTVKLHGTNAQVSFDGENLLAGKRSSLLGEDQLQAHFGFNQFVQVTHKEYFQDLMEKMYNVYCKEGQQIMLYGEFAGKGIQKGVGISELNKAFYIFDAKVYDKEKDKSEWLDISTWDFEPEGVFNIYDFPTYKIDIDFNKPQEFQNKLVEITEAVEKECPVSKQLGINEGCGEGVVWTGFWRDEKYIFKVKGQKHSTSKVKKLASVDPEVLKNINEFVDYAATKNRIEQGMQETNSTEKRHMPDLLRWVANDIISEEDDVLQSNKLEWKQVAKEVSNRVRQYFFEKIDKF